MVRRIFEFTAFFGLLGLIALAALGTMMGTASPSAQNMPLLTSAALPMATGLGGFLVGLTWRFLCFELPAMAMRWFEHNRHHFGAFVLLVACVAIVIFA